MFSYRIICLFLITLLCASINANDIDEYAAQIMGLIGDPVYETAFQSHINKLLSIDPDYFQYKNYDADINCKDYSPSDQVPTDVNKIRPGDIKVVGAMGDSLTAAVGAKAKTIVGILIENREVSWSIGGQSNLERFATLPNILKKFNPNIKGFSSWPSVVSLTKEGVGFNVAVSGNKAFHIIDQARVLIQRMKESKEINYEQDWKLLTLFIGGNDLCATCKNQTLHSPQQYIDDIKAALDLLQKEMPRTIVNLINTLNVEELDELNVNPVCTIVHRFFCPCAAFPPSDEDRKRLHDYFIQYSNYTGELVKSGRYDTTDDFTVVYQPFYREFGAPRLPDGKIDITYFAPDCFHFSLKSHAMSGIALWNSMLAPVGKKSFTVDINAKISCPSQDHPYIYTNKNSVNGFLSL